MTVSVGDGLGAGSCGSNAPVLLRFCVAALDVVFRVTAQTPTETPALANTNAARRGRRDCRGVVGDLAMVGAGVHAADRCEGW